MPYHAAQARGRLSVNELRERAAARLLGLLEADGYDFVTITPESHRRVVARPDMAWATDLRGIFGWSLPFERALLADALFGFMEEAQLLDRTAAGWKSRIRVSRVAGRLFIHSAFPTESDDSVFLGPDTARFCDFIRAEIGPGELRRIVDIGTGAGVGGIVAGGLAPGADVQLADINPLALSYARANAAHAGLPVTTIESDGVAAVEPGFDLAVINPPFIFEEGAPAYRGGGGMHGAQLSLEWTLGAAAKLTAGGRVLLYTGSAIVAGRDGLRAALAGPLEEMGCTLRWRELDPDIFGEELEKPAYAEVERIAAIGGVVEKQG